MRALTLAVLFASLVGVCCDAEEFAPKRSVQWQPYVEWEVRNDTWDGNPYDVLAKVRFEHPSGKTHVTEMFYDGANTWKFRFTATAPGRWSLATKSDDPDLDGHRGVVDVAAADPAAIGFMTNVGNRWARQTGPEGAPVAFVPQIVMYVDDLSFLWKHQDRIDADIDNLLGRHGFTGLHLSSIAGRWFDIEGPRAVTAEMTDPDPRTFALVEKVILNVHRAGGIVHIWPWGDRARRWTPTELEDGINGPADRRLQRYIAARLGPLPGWSMGYGFDLQEWVKAERLKQWHDYMHDHLGWFHFLGGRAGGPTSGTDHAPYVALNEPQDYSGYQHWQPSYEVYAAAMQCLPDQPVMSEDRFRVRGRAKDYTEEQTRRGLYRSTMAGGVANIWGNLRGSEDERPGGMSADYPHPDWIKTYSTFFFTKQRFRTGLRRFDDLSDGHCLAEVVEGRYVIYGEATGKLRVDLSGAEKPLPAVAVDALEPYREIELGVLGASEQTINLPHESDWVIAIGRF